MGPMVTGAHDAEHFVSTLLGAPGLRELVRLFSDDAEGLPARIAYLSDLRESLAPGEREQAQRVLDAWNDARPLAPAPPDSDLRQQARWMVALARQRFDFRCGRERSFIPHSRELLAPEVAEVVYAVADAWGMRAPNVAEGDFGLVVVLGGLIRANINRPALAAQLIASAKVRTGEVTALAAQRPLGEAEIDVARQLGCPWETESESLAWGMSGAFHAADRPWMPVAPGIQQIEHEIRVTCATAPKPGSGGRADTQSAFQWLLAAVPSITTSASRVLCVTSAIYWIDGHIRLLTQLPAGTTLVTTGTTGENSNPLLEQNYRSQHYLQEIKSALNALPGLLAWARP